MVRNTNLSKLKLWVSDTASGAGLSFTDPFDADTLAYIGSQTFGGRDNIFIEAVAEHPNATVTGAGLRVTTVGVNEFLIVVTSEDTHATKTYTITCTRT